MTIAACLTASRAHHLAVNAADKAAAADLVASQDCRVLRRIRIRDIAPAIRPHLVAMADAGLVVLYPEDDRLNLNAADAEYDVRVSGTARHVCYITEEMMQQPWL